MSLTGVKRQLVLETVQELKDGGTVGVVRKSIGEYCGTWMSERGIAYCLIQLWASGKIDAEKQGGKILWKAVAGAGSARTVFPVPSS